jgi:PAS domain S-box-containing protein
VEPILVQPSSAGNGTAIPPDAASPPDPAQVPAVLRRDWNGVILDWSPGCERLFGIPAIQAQGRDIDAILWRSLPIPRLEIEAVLLRGGSWSGEIGHRLPDGRVLTLAAHWRLDPSGQPGQPGAVAEMLTGPGPARQDGGDAVDFRILAECLPALVFVADGQGRLLHANRAFQDHAGLPEAALLGDGWLAALHPEDREAMAAAWTRTPPGGGLLEAEWRLRRHDGAWRRILVRARPELGADRHRVLRWYGAGMEPAAPAGGGAAEAPRLSLAQEAAGLGLWEHDPATDRLWASPRFRSLHGLPEAGELALSAWLERVPTEDRPMLEATLRAALEAGAPFLQRYRIGPAEGGRGRVRWIEARGRRLDRADGGGGPGRFTGVCLDVTAQKAEEDRTALLMREVDHRARNVLATVQALLRLTRAESPEGYARALEGRIATLGRAQALLTTERWAGAGLRALLEAEFAPYSGTESSRLLLRGPALVLARSVVQPLSMAVHELVTNAAKHGALSRPGGQVVVEWSRTAEGRLRLDWQEAGLIMSDGIAPINNTCRAV